VCKYRDDDGRGNPFGPHAHNEEDSCAEAGQEESNPEEPAQKEITTRKNRKKFI
jgi:hypothetical protein